LAWRAWGARCAGIIARAGDAYYSDPACLQQPRDWSGAPAADRQTDSVSDAELRSALKVKFASSFGIAAEDAVRDAYALMGFRRVAAAARDRARILLEALLAEGSVSERDGVLRDT
jgi:hypothetical protein